MRGKKRKRWFVIVELAGYRDYHGGAPFVAVFRGTEEGAELYANMLLGEGNYVILPITETFVDEEEVDWDGLARAGMFVSAVRK